MKLLAALVCILAPVSAWSQTTPEVLRPRSIPLSSLSAYIFSAPLAVDTPPRLFILDGLTLTIHDVLTDVSQITMNLPSGATAVDIIDIDGDDSSDVVVVAGSIVFFQPITTNATASVWNKVLERSSLYTDTVARPFPQALVLKRGEHIAVALPQTMGFEMWSLEGDLLEVVDYGQSDIATTVPTPPFDARAIEDQAGGVGVQMVHALSSQRIPATVDTPVDSNSGQLSDPTRDVSELPSDQWPAFPVRQSRQNLLALYAAIPPKFEDTFVRIEQVDATGRGSSNVGPPRRYPGRILVGDFTWPDFDRDGLTDLVTWKPAAAGTSIAALLDTVWSDTRPVSLAIHRFDPDRRLFDPEPLAVIRANLPLEWFNSAKPLRNVIYRDVDADGMIDVGFSTRPHEYSIWSRRTGFERGPAYVVRSQDPIERIIRDIDLGSEADSVVLFQSTNAVLVVHIPSS